MPYKDPEKKRQAEREWRKKNKDKLKAYREKDKNLKIRQRIYAKKYREKNKEKLKQLYSTEKYKNKSKEKMRKYRKSNIEYRKRQNEFTKEWRKKNKCKTQGYRKKWHLENKDKPEYKTIKNLRRRLREVLKGQKKSNSFMLLLGCSIEFFIEYMESKFEPGMTWENYGNPNGDHSNCWHVDHIKPCCSFDLSDPEQQKICFHYTNLQPLWGKDNLRKNKY